MSHGWEESKIDAYIKACEALAERSGGSVESVDYLEQAKSDDAMRAELYQLGKAFLTTNEDTAILKMALDLKCDLVVSNDREVLRARAAKVLKWSIKDMATAMAKLTSPITAVAA
jgi:rRNA-processing protein FCF1